MKNQTTVPNVPLNGLVMDDHPLYQREGTYTYLLNGRKVTEDFINHGRSNALSNKEFTEDLGEVVGATLVEERNQWVVFSRKGGATVSLVSAETGEVTEVINLGSCGVDFSSCEGIYAEMKTMQPCSELFVYFSSQCFYYVLNIDALLDPKRKDEYTCDDFLLFKCVCVPDLKPEISSAAGGDLQAGAYRFVAQLEDEDGNTTNWFQVSYPLSIESENNIAGEIAKSTIRITLENLDTRYHKLNLAVIKNIGGVETCEMFPSFYYSGTNFTYEYYGQKGEPLLIEEILTTRRTYIRGKDLVQKDNTLLLYNILQRRNLDYQRRANNIKVKGVVYVAKAEDAHRYRTLIRGERYLFSIGWTHCSGEKTHAFALSNYGGFAGIDLDGEGEAGQQIIPRTTSAGSATEDITTVTLEETRKDDEDNPDYAGGVAEDTFDRLDDLITGTPQAEADPCIGCGADQTQDVINYGDTFGAISMDSITNAINSTRIKNRGSKKKSNNSAEGIKNLLNEIKSLAEDDEENKEVYEIIKYTPVDRQNFDKENLDVLLTNKELAKVTEFDFKVFESTAVYPLTKDCMGEYIYGDLAGQPVRLLEVPNDAEIPFYVSFQNGVKSKISMGVDEFEDAYCFFIGLKVEGVEFPTDDELHTPLCEDNPYTVYMAETTPINRRIIAKGIMPHTFSGLMNGKEYAFPKHAVNSIEHIDRHIQNGEDNNHQGEPHLAPIFTFHSPDTAVGKPRLNVDNVYIPGEVTGIGRRHGQYAFGDEPASAFFGRQKDQRGTRQSINLNKNEFTREATIPVKGITFAKGNKAITNANGIDLSLCNLYRESSVFMQLEALPEPLADGVQNGYADHSFIGDGLNHECNIPYAASHYGVLRNELAEQYGSVESLVYIDSGLAADGRQTTIEGIVGDGFIGPWTLKRTSYVSNKVGDKAIRASRRRVSGLLQFFGFGDCTRPPDSGDDKDNKNLANLHPNARCGTRPEGPIGDLYFPRVVNTMVAFWVESRINVWLRATGVETGKVFYPKLKDLELDSSVPNGTVWTNGWLNRFYCSINRASKFLIMLRAAIRLIVFFYGLYLVVDSILSINSIPDIFTTILRAILITLLWVLAFFFIFTNRNLNKLFGLDECLDDRQGAYNYEPIKGWEDNYVDYNPDYSIQNRLNFAIGVPDPYNVCDCDDCEKNEVTHEIFLSNPQVVGSPIDSYKNYQANSYLTFPLNEGKITKMFNFNDQLIAHTTDALKVVSFKGVDIRLNEDSSLQFKGLDIGGEGRNIFISGGYLERAQSIGGSAPEGSLGLQHYNHSRMFPFGYVFIDEKSGKVWVMESLTSLKDLTVTGNKAFFRDNLNLCGDHTCIGEGVPGEGGYAFGYDPYEELLYITKKDTGCNSFTMSYDLENGYWFGFHSFKPQLFLNDRKNFFSLESNKLWIHNQDKDSFQTYYGNFYPHIVEFVTKQNILSTPELDSFAFYTQATRNLLGSKVYNLKETFNKAVFYNNTQCSGELILRPEADSLGNRDNLLLGVKDTGFVVPLVWQGEEWRVNRIRDAVVNHELPVWINTCECSNDKVLNFGNLSLDKPAQSMNIIYDKFLKARFTYDNPSAADTQLITHFTTAINKTEVA